MTADWLDVLLLGLMVASMLVAGWVNSARAEAEKTVPLQFRESGQIKWMIDPYVWSRAASPTIRRRYLITGGVFVLGMTCLTISVWRHKGYPHGEAGVIVAIVANCIVAAAFVRACFRYWRMRQSNKSL
jgi:hypothetical protein